jgi:hypothetical protein
MKVNVGVLADCCPNEGQFARATSRRVIERPLLAAG